MTHNVESLFLYIHPTLAILGYIFIITSYIAIVAENKMNINTKLSRKNLYLAWLFNFTGLISGMMWAQFAWGIYWNWDPKETATLALFTLVCFSVFTYENYRKLSQFLLVMSIVIIVLNIIITVSNVGLHSY